MAVATDTRAVGAAAAIAIGGTVSLDGATVYGTPDGRRPTRGWRVAVANASGVRVRY